MSVLHNKERLDLKIAASFDASKANAFDDCINASSDVAILSSQAQPVLDKYTRLELNFG